MKKIKTKKIFNKINDALILIGWYEYNKEGKIIRYNSDTDPVGSTYKWYNDNTICVITRDYYEEKNIYHPTIEKYDLDGKLINVFEGLELVRSYEYDSHGNTIKSTLLSRVINIDNKYDENGNLVESIFSDGTKSEYTYDENGNNVSAYNGINEFVYEYDTDNNLIKEICDGRETVYQYEFYEDEE